jgi:hypothetical chaperone protein
VFVERPEKEQLAQERLRRAAQRAGFGRVEFQYEPIAAGLAYEMSLGRPELALIADLGGGTSDFTVMRLGTNTSASRREDILATGGVQIGGDTFDARIMARKLASFFGSGTTYRTMEGRDLPFPSRLLAQLGHWHQVPFLRARKTRDLLARLRATSNEPDAVARFEGLLDGNGAFFLFEEIERAKSRLSREDEARIEFHLGTIDVDVTITRPEFEAMIAADLAQVAACMRDVLSRAGVGPGDVDAVFVTGGSAQVPAVRALFVDAFGPDRLRAQEYLTSVACGLGLAAARSRGDQLFNRNCPT